MKRFLRGTTDGSVLSWDEPLCSEHGTTERPAFAADKGEGTYDVELECGCTAQVHLHFEQPPEGVTVERPDPEKEREQALFQQFMAEQFEAWKASRPN